MEINPEEELSRSQVSGQHEIATLFSWYGLALPPAYTLAIPSPRFGCEESSSAGDGLPRSRPGTESHIFQPVEIGGPVRRGTPRPRRHPPQKERKVAVAIVIVLLAGRHALDVWVKT